MDIAVVSGDRQIPNPNEFPETLTPFPEPTDLVYAHSAATIRPPEAPNRRPASPPQKLRPIRCSRSSRSAAPAPAPEADRVGLGSGSFAEGWETSGTESESRLIYEHNQYESDRFFSDLSLSSSDGNDHSSAKLKEPTNRKRKRKSRNLCHFLEKMVNKVMEKQEQMHTQLVETIEKIEKERIRREEAWRQMEIERLKKDEALRAQETSRSLALVSFLRNLMGEEIQTPEPISQHRTEEENWVKISDAQTNAKYPSNKRWPEAEVQALITLRSTLDHKFCGSGSKGSIWEEVSDGMSAMGYARTAKKCKEKWENMNKYFRRLTENGKKRSSDKTCPYFHELDLLYKNGVINSGLGFSSGDEAKSERDSGSPQTG